MLQPQQHLQNSHISHCTKQISDDYNSQTQLSQSNFSSVRTNLLYLLQLSSVNNQTQLQTKSLTSINSYLSLEADDIYTTDHGSDSSIKINYNYQETLASFNNLLQNDNSFVFNNTPSMINNAPSMNYSNASSFKSDLSAIDLEDDLKLIEFTNQKPTTNLNKLKLQPDQTFFKNINLQQYYQQLKQKNHQHYKKLYQNNHIMFINHEWSPITAQ